MNLDKIGRKVKITNNYSAYPEYIGKLGTITGYYADDIYTVKMEDGKNIIPYTEEYRVSQCELLPEENKTNNMNKPQPFNITGNKHLIEAIGKELVEIGYEFNEYWLPHSYVGISSCTDEINTKEDFLRIADHSTAKKTYIKFSLPTQYQEALDYCREALKADRWAPEFKVGDIVHVHARGLHIGYKGRNKVAKVMSIHPYKNSEGELNLILDNNIGEISPSFVEAATKEQIEQYNKPHYKVGDYVTFLPEKCVGKWFHCLTSFWDKKKTFIISHLSEDNIIVNSGSNSIHVFRPATEEEIRQYKNEQETKVLTLGTSGIKITITKDSIKAEGTDFSYEKLQELYNGLNKMGQLNQISGYAITIPSVKIGCSSFTLEELNRILTTFREMDN